MEELQESELGTQEYWNKRYREEMSNFESHGDPGEVWFGEDIVERIIRWMMSLPKSSKILDIGCGNGMFLVELGSEGFDNLQGVDYSEGAIKLAENVAKKNDIKIKYWSCDILEGLEGNFDVIHDKGTYDAISLSENPKENRNKYLKTVHGSLNDTGVFVITSCNWTKHELDAQFSDYFVCFANIPTPQFKFGGKTGNVVTSAVYKKLPVDN